MNLQIFSTDPSTAFELVAWVTTEDLVVSENVEQALRGNSYRALWNLRVSAFPSGVQLEGTVPTYHLKQLAQVIALKVSGVRELRNEVRVISVR
jgi:osmotically-inducible protein OsmY